MALIAPSLVDDITGFRAGSKVGFGPVEDVGDGLIAQGVRRIAIRSGSVAAHGSIIAKCRTAGEVAKSRDGLTANYETAIAGSPLISRPRAGYRP